MAEKIVLKDALGKIKFKSGHVNGRIFAFDASGNKVGFKPDGIRIAPVVLLDNKEIIIDPLPVPPANEADRRQKAQDLARRDENLNRAIKLVESAGYFNEQTDICDANGNFRFDLIPAISTKNATGDPTTADYTIIVRAHNKNFYLSGEHSSAENNNGFGKNEPIPQYYLADNDVPPLEIYCEGINIASPPPADASGNSSAAPGASTPPPASGANMRAGGVNGKKQEAPQAGDALFFWTWWAFKDEGDVKDLDDNGMYPRDIGKGSRPSFIEAETKNKFIIEDNAKPEGSVTGTFLGMSGVSPIEREFSAEEVFDPEILKTHPIVALAVAIGFRSDWHRSGMEYRTVNAEPLRWKYKWQNFMTGETPVKVYGRVVDNEKVKAVIGKDLFTQSASLTADEVGKILEAGNDFGIVSNDRAEVTLSQQGSSKTYSDNAESDGTFVFKNIPRKPTKADASLTNHTKNQHTYPATEFVTFPKGEEFRGFIIPLKPKKEREYKLLIYPNNDKHVDHVTPKTRPFGGPATTTFEKGKEHDDHVQTFTIVGSPPPGKKVLLFTKMVKVTKNEEVIDRDDGHFNKIGVYTAYGKTGAGQFSMGGFGTASYVDGPVCAHSVKPKVPILLNSYNEIKSVNKSQVNIYYSVDVSKVEAGKYRFYAFLIDAEKKKDNPTYEELTDASFDYNYHEVYVSKTDGSGGSSSSTEPGGVKPPIVDPGTSLVPADKTIDLNKAIKKVQDLIATFASAGLKNSRLNRYVGKRAVMFEDLFIDLASIDKEARPLQPKVPKDKSTFVALYNTYYSLITDLLSKKKAFDAAEEAAKKEESDKNKNKVKTTQAALLASWQRIEGAVHQELKPNYFELSELIKKWLSVAQFILQYR